MADRTLQFRKPPIDQPQRDAAVDTTRSVIVQAPAGSGKTSLLTERFLRLLAQVDDPQCVLALTFTRSAKAEMHGRLMAALTFAAGKTPGRPKGPDSIIEAAHLALGVSRELGWNLLEQPDLLNVQTIDSLAASIARQTPLTSSLAPGLEPVENADSFYKQAALKTLQKLGLSDSKNLRDRQTAEAAALLLRQRDNQWQRCADLLARMLGTRDQWGRLFPMATDDLTDGYLDAEVRPKLEGHLRAVIERHLESTTKSLASNKDLCRRLLVFIRYVAADASQTFFPVGDIADFPGCSAIDLPLWQAMTCALLIKDGSGRKRFAKRDGFFDGFSREMTKHAKSVIEDICSDSSLQDSLHQIRALPPLQFSEAEWLTAKAMFRLLLQALVELRVSFNAQGLADFTEVGLAAMQALGGDPVHPSELALDLGDKLQHVLIDEFQDTSRTQHALLELLLANWESGDGRTLFCVGDPQQSIYMFRQAAVELFKQAAENGVASIKMEFLQLSVNFRSHYQLVEDHNRTLSAIFGDSDKYPQFTASHAYIRGANDPALHWHFSVKPSTREPQETKAHALDREANQTCDLAESALATPNATVAILVRAKSHAYRIMRCLHQRKIGFRAIDMEPLSDRQEVLDVFSLTRAILNPADRVAWLALLRAPWSGLGLTALSALAGDAKSETIAASIASRIANLPPEDQARAHRAIGAVNYAVAQSRDARQPFSVWQAWKALGGDACVDDEQFANVCAYFAMLEQMDEQGRDLRCDTIQAEMERLCASPNPNPSLRLEILTIHKAKGLEWDTVIVPQLDRHTGGDDTTAVGWLEDEIDGDAAWFIAPVGLQGTKASPMQAWLRARHSQKQADESKRLFYVAATRAAGELHLLGAVALKKDGISTPHKNSLLHTAWPAAREIAEHQLQSQPQSHAQPELFDIAAAAGRPRQNMLRRLSQEWFEESTAHQATAVFTSAAPPPPRAPNFVTHAGNERRVGGTVLHAFLERAAQRRSQGDDWAVLHSWAQAAGPDVVRMMLSGGVPPSRISRYAPNVHALLQKALASPTGRWVLGNHADAWSEYPISAWNGEECAEYRVDRVFAAGSDQLSLGNSHVWIIDYKSAVPGTAPVADFLAEQAAAYADRMFLYAKALRAARSDPRPILCALYFPALDLVHPVNSLD